MLNFLQHDDFIREYEAFAAKYHCHKDFEFLKKLLLVHYDPIKPIQVIGPGKLHRVKECEGWVLWKIEMAVKGLRKNQSPRVWFAIEGDTLAFLTIKSHIDNYDTNQADRLAEGRVTDIF